VVAELTDFRTAVWQAIDDDATATASLRKKYKLDSKDQMFPMSIPTASMPALLILPSGLDVPWATNMQRDYHYSLEFHLWTASHVPDEAERIIEELLEAIHQSNAPKSATGSGRLLFSRFSWTPIKTDPEGAPAWHVFWQLGLPKYIDPRT